MLQSKFLEELAENKENQKIGQETFVIPLEEGSIKRGRSLQEIIKEMKKASTEKLLKTSDDITYC
jgi:hypothetical protein